MRQSAQIIISESKKKDINNKLKILYGENRAYEVYNSLMQIINTHKTSDIKEWVDQKDIMLITYADSIKNDSEKPLKTLHSFLKTYVKDFINCIHILPFYPYSSDDGFSVIDYYKVNAELGDWEDIIELSADFKLMFDAVINHISAKSDWFSEYLKGVSEFQDFFIEADPKKDYSSVTRPRALPLLSEFETVEGEKYIWTTFSADQIDLNYKYPEVFLKIIDLLLTYSDYNTTFLRLDAIGYMWKEDGTNCINLPQAHIVVQLIRDVFEAAAPYVKLITETNVPHKDNISYFGNGHNEAHMVYNFSLPPLTLYSFLTGDSRYLSNWAASLEKEPQSEETTFFNFLASHDGIGVMPTRGYLSENELNNMIEKIKSHGGLVSYKSNIDGSKSAYELNINYMDALSHPNDDEELRLKRFLAAHSILLSMRGMPGIYIHSLLGSRSYHDGVKSTGINRAINREKLKVNELISGLNDVNSLRYKVLNGIKHLIDIRKEQTAFHPNASQKVLFLDPHVFSVLRISKNKECFLLSITNVSGKYVDLSVNNIVELSDYNTKQFKDLISDAGFNVFDNIKLEPYQSMWLRF